MFHIYSRYLIRHMLGPALFIALALTGVAWLTQSLRLVDHIVNQGLSIGIFLYMTLLIMPSLLSVVLPVALFSAALYSYNRLLMDSELIMFENAGLSMYALARPALTVASGAVVISYAISLYFLPASYREFKDLQSFIRDHYASVLLQEQVFNTPIKGMTIYIREKRSNGMLRGILAHDNRVPGKPVTRMAEEGRLVQTPTGPRVILVNGNQQEVDRQNGRLSLIYFDRYDLDLSLFADVQESRWREPKERFLHELFFPEPESPPQLYPQLRAEGHQRLVWPLYNMTLTLVGLAAMLSGQFNRRGNMKRIGKAVIVAVMVTALGVGLQNVAARYPQAIVLMYANVALVAAGSLYILLRRRPAAPRYNSGGPLHHHG